MKIVTRSVIIENKEFYLVSDHTDDGKKYYATIPYENTRDGVLIKGMNGLEMCISFEGPAEAIVNRKKSIVMNRIVDRLMGNGLDRMGAVIAMIDDPEYKALYNEA